MNRLLSVVRSRTDKIIEVIGVRRLGDDRFGVNKPALAEIPCVVQTQWMTTAQRMLGERLAVGIEQDGNLGRIQPTDEQFQRRQIHIPIGTDDDQARDRFLNHLCKSHADARRPIRREKRRQGSIGKADRTACRCCPFQPRCSRQHPVPLAGRALLAIVNQMRNIGPGLGNELLLPGLGLRAFQRAGKFQITGKTRCREIG